MAIGTAETPTPIHIRSRLTAVAPWLLGATLLLGAAFRLIWSETIEYKRDEAWLFQLVADHVNRWDWATVGMPSSQNVRVPGLSVWVFYPFGHLFGVDEPTCLTLGVQLSNIAALIGLVVFAWRCVPAAEREPWLWAAALIAVNPLEVIYHRKLWPPCMLPIFCMVFIIGWWHRDRRWGAAVWGTVGACLGQIHAAGFLFALSVVLTTVAAARRGVRWGWWVAGSVLGTLPMTGWFIYLLRDRDPVGGNAVELHRWLECKFWLHWITEPVGWGLHGEFGADYTDFLRWPLIGGRPTFAAGILQFLTILLGVALLAHAANGWWRRRSAVTAPPTRTATGLLVRAGFVCFGLMLTLAAVRFFRHYLIVTFPLMALWLARLALPDGSADRTRVLGRRLLAGLCAVNALSCFLMLSFLRENGGVCDGAFQATYEAQVRDGGLRPPDAPIPE
jgi:hypothetical protein